MSALSPTIPTPLISSPVCHEPGPNPPLRGALLCLRGNLTSPPRTKALVLELLAAVCLVRGGHDIILAAFDNFKEVQEAPQRPTVP